MLEGLRAKLAAVPWRLRRALARVRRFERRELRHLRRQVERTRTLVHLSILLLAPPLVGLFVALANRFDALSFFLFPPLAAGTYTLFSNPESEQSSPARFVGGLTTGAVCAWIAVEIALRFVYPGIDAGALSVDAPGAAFAILLTGVVTWGLDVEEPAAYAIALLGLLVPQPRQPAFVLSVIVGSTLVAGVFYAWRGLFYERRATYLYESVRGDDHVLVPVCGDRAAATAMLGARLAAAHDAGKVVLLDVVEGPDRAAAERAALDREDLAGGAGPPAAVDSDEDGTAGDGSEDATDVDAAREAIEAAASDLEALAGRIETRVGVPCQVLVAAAGPSRSQTVLTAAREADCDLLCVPYETRHGTVTPFVRELFRGNLDVVLHRSRDGRTSWRDAMVPVRGTSDVAHGMVDFALRLAGRRGRVSVCHCIPSERERRRADAMLADLVEPFEGTIETRVARSSIERFLARNAGDYDLVCLGASRDRSVASRLISPPTFERIEHVDADVAVVDRS